jgi:hypothetical protein
LAAGEADPHRCSSLPNLFMHAGTLTRSCATDVSALPPESSSKARSGDVHLHTSAEVSTLMPGAFESQSGNAWRCSPVRSVSEYVRTKHHTSLQCFPKFSTCMHTDQRAHCRPIPSVRHMAALSSVRNSHTYWGGTHNKLIVKLDSGLCHP